MTRQEAAGRALTFMAVTPIVVGLLALLNWVAVGCPPWHVIVSLLGG